jgi:hypothetical protein
MSTKSTVKFSNANWAQSKAEDPAYQACFANWVAGMPWKTNTEATGVGYASGWLFCVRMALLLNEPDQAVSLEGLTETQAANRIAEMRLAEGNSWGRIMARTGLTETSCRKLFEQKTGVFSEGLRNGKGGRFLGGNAEAYAPAPKVGWVRKADAEASLPAEIVAGLLAANAIEAADVEELQGMTLKALRGMAKAFGLPTAGTKADLVARIAEAYAA